MSKILNFSCSPTWLEGAGADGKPAGLPRFSMVAYTGALMRLAFWRYPVIVDLAGMEIPSQKRPIRMGHDSDQGVGHSESIAVEGGQLIATGVVSRDTPAAKDVVSSSRNGFPWQASIGASAEIVEFVKEKERVVVNGREVDGPVNVVRKSVLGEISFVDLGADGATSASVAASKRGDAAKAKEPNMETEGKDGEGKVEAAAPVAAVEIETKIDLSGVRAEAAGEIKRIAEVQKIAAKHPEIAAKAIAEVWDATKTELEVMRADRPTAPAVHASSGEAMTGKTLECAVAISAKMGGVEKDFDAKTIEAADKRFRGGIGLQELLLEAAWANGYTGRTFRDTREILRFAFGRQDVSAGFSSVDIGGILSNVANKNLLAGFSSVEQTWRAICAIRNVKDFKTVTSYRMTSADQYEKVGPGGEIKHGTLGEESFTNKADTYAKMFGITRQDIINDDLGALTDIPRRLGRGAGLKLNDVIWTAFMDNASFFSGTGKYISGSNTNLSVVGLEIGKVAFDGKTDSDGKPLGAQAKILLVPSALSVTGAVLMKSLEIRDNTANTKTPTANPFAGAFQLESSAYLGNSAYAGYSALAWYLLDDPLDIATIEVAFLNGQESPTIESTDADFDTLGIRSRGYHDFGVAKQDARGGLKSKGAA